MKDGMWLDHEVTREDRADGTIVLGSGLTLDHVARNTGEWLHRWAAETPDRVFIAERSGGGWREVAYGEMLAAVRAVAASLLARGFGPGKRIVILSGPSVDHAVLALAAQYIGAPIVPLAEQYSLIPAAHPRLAYCVNKVSPAMVYAGDGDAFGTALALDIFDGVEKVVSHNPADGMTGFETLLAGEADAAVDAAHAKVGPETLAKILFTSGSASAPKGVPQTQKMMCVNQAQYQACLPILKARHHKMLDWLPWNHVFAGNSNFNMMLANGGSLYLDDGKPVGPLAARSLENLRAHSGTLSFNVPVAHAMQVAAMRNDADLRRRYFEGLDIFFYAGASLPADVWAAIGRMARDELGEMPMMMSSWGMTETAPSALIYHEKGAASGMIGVPVPELEAKLIPVGDNRYELRVRGPNVIDCYYEDAKRSAESFDDEGFFMTGDAVTLVDPMDASRGVRFDGRIGEDFKLTTGIWVQASNLRLTVLAGLSGLAQDVVIVGEGRDEVGLLVFPPPARGLKGGGGVVVDPHYASEIREVLVGMAKSATGSSNRIVRAIVLEEPPHVGDGEITAKGSLNVRTILTRRAAFVDRLYDDADTATIRI
ncbi:MAG: AMP-binding protein [Rhizobiaceae bacterium]